MSEPREKPPAVTVLMPAYNSAPYLSQAVQSILEQTFTDFEFLCVDDGSHDQTLSILRSFAEHDPRVRVISKANGGVTSALIAGLHQATGEFVARMDADDVAEPRRLELQVGYLRANPNCVACGCHILKIDAAGRIIEPAIPFTTHEEICAELWKANAGALPHFGVTLRRSALQQIGGYNPSFRTAQDLDLFLRLAEVGKLVNIPQPLMQWRIHASAVTISRAEEQAANAREILRQAYARRGQKLPASVKKWERFVVAAKRLRWGWTALEQGRYGEARRSALKVIWRQPLRRYGYQLAFHAALGPWGKRAGALLRSIRGGGGGGAPTGPLPSAPAHIDGSRP